MEAAIKEVRLPKTITPVKYPIWNILILDILFITKILILKSLPFLDT